MKPTPRDIVYSHLAAQIGGWNASAGAHMGRLRDWDDEFRGDDAKLVAYLLRQHLHDTTFSLRQEVERLKSRLYDLEHP